MFYIYIRLLCETFQLKGGSSICGLGCSSSSFSFFLYFLLLHPLHSWPKNVEGTSPMECMGGRGGSSPHVGFATVPTRDRSGCAPPPLPPARNSIEDEGRRGREERKEGGGNEPLRSCALDLTSYESQAKWFDSGISNPLKNHGVIILLYEFLAKK
jgi:hypothetical protein